MTVENLVLPFALSAIFGLRAAILFPAWFFLPADQALILTFVFLGLTFIQELVK